jgi:hypothetical protein
MRNGRNKWAETLNLIRGPRKFALGYVKSRKQATPESRFHLIRGKRRKHLRRRKAIHRPRAHEKLTAFVELESLIGAFFFAYAIRLSPRFPEHFTRSNFVNVL